MCEWTGVPYRLISVTRIGSGFVVTLSRIKWLVKLNEWMGNAFCLEGGFYIAQINTAACMRSCSFIYKCNIVYRIPFVYFKLNL